MESRAARSSTPAARSPIAHLDVDERLPGSPSPGPAHCGVGGTVRSISAGPGWDVVMSGRVAEGEVQVAHHRESRRRPTAAGSRRPPGRTPRVSASAGPTRCGGHSGDLVAARACTGKVGMPARGRVEPGHPDHLRRPPRSRARSRRRHRPPRGAGSSRSPRGRRWPSRRAAGYPGPAFRPRSRHQARRSRSRGAGGGCGADLPGQRKLIEKWGPRLHAARAHTRNRHLRSHEPGPRIGRPRNRPHARPSPRPTRSAGHGRQNLIALRPGSYRPPTSTDPGQVPEVTPLEERDSAPQHHYHSTRSAPLRRHPESGLMSQHAIRGIVAGGPKIMARPPDGASR
jgi:hypothetical protein